MNGDEQARVAAELIERTTDGRDLERTVRVAGIVRAAPRKDRRSSAA